MADGTLPGERGTVKTAFRIALVLLAIAGVAKNLGLFSGKSNFQTLAYYTIQSNILVAAYFIFELLKGWRKRAGAGGAGMDAAAGAATAGSRPAKRGGGAATARAWVAAPALKGGVTFAITITMLIYNAVLVPTLSASSGYRPYTFFDTLVHVIVPAMTILDWILFDRKPAFAKADPLKWLLIPIAYLVFAMLRAQLGKPLGFSGSRYPYFFMDIDRLGPMAAARNVAMLTVAFLGLGYLFYLADRWLGGRARFSRARGG